MTPRPSLDAKAAAPTGNAAPGHAGRGVFHQTVATAGLSR
jgi:hypothetical protein